MAHISTVTADRESAILQACLALLAEQGYQRLTIDAVAARARASKATIYRHWSGKREMVTAAVNSLRTDRSADTPDTGSLRGDLKAQCRYFAHTLQGLNGRLILGLLQSKLTDPDLCRELEDALPSGAKTDPAVVSRAMGRGELTHDIDTGVIDELIGAVLLNRVIFDRPMSDEYIQHLVDNIVLPAVRNADTRQPPSSTGTSSTAHAPRS